MIETGHEIPRLAFSEKYTDEHARQYYHKHNNGVMRKVATWREISIARKALKIAGNPRSILDLPSGTGRFWPMLAEDETRKLYAADYNQTMLDMAIEMRAPVDVQRFEAFQSSAFDIPRPNNFVDCIFSMRLLHHIGNHNDRMKMLREFYRVASDTVVISLWVDGNQRARKRAQRDQYRKNKPFKNRFVIPRAKIEEEMRAADFRIVDHVDHLKYYSMLRIYILRKC